MAKERIILIDGSGYIFRAFYAIQRLSTKKGFPTNAIYGFLTMLIKVLENEKPTKLLIAFDTGKPTKRKERYAEYKANRVAPPPDLEVQFPIIPRAVDCMNVYRLDREGWEADDILGTVAKKAVAAGYTVEIITGDKDLMQLVSPGITLYDPMKDKKIDREQVIEKFGVTPEQVIDLLALMGDSSDNIPGVTGVGEKTATQLIQEFGSLKSLYAKLDKLPPGKRKDTLEKEKEIAFLSQELATIDCDMPLKLDWDDFNYNGPNLDLLKGFCEEFEFHHLMKKFQLETKGSTVDRSHYKIICNEKELAAVVKELKAKPFIAVDTETTSLAIHTAELVGVSLCGEAGKGYYVPIGHHMLGDATQKEKGQIDPEVTRRYLKDLLEDQKVAKIGQNIKFDFQILKNFGVEITNITDDTMLASYVIDPEQPHGLDSLAFRYLNHQNITYEELCGKGKSQISFAEVAIEKAGIYAAEDADVTFRLNMLLSKEIKEKNLTQLYTEIEVPLLSVLADMEFTGVLVDKNKLEELSKKLLKQISEKETKIHELAGEAFNIQSPKQLSKILFEKLKLPVIRKTKTGYSTDESVLTELADKSEIGKWIIDYRELCKLKSTYVDGLLEQIHPKTGRVHTRFNQTITATGRLSSSDPNLQNIPDQSEIRSVFIAKPGCQLISADYSQIELRLLAELSQDPTLIKAFDGGTDIHAFTAKQIFNVKEVTNDQRKIAKTINFGVIYGQTAYGLSQLLKISPGEAKKFIDTYFERYAKVKGYFEKVIEGARKNGYVTTLIGRRRYLPEINSEQKMRREFAERAAMNAPLQGTAADMIKIAMIQIYRRLADEKLKSKLILQVHDELVIESPEAEVERATRILKEEMEGAMELKVPIRVDIGHGTDWSLC